MARRADPSTGPESTPTRPRWEVARERLLAARRFRVVNLAFIVSERDRSDGGSILSGALAFRIFFWLLPATLVVVGCLGFVNPQDAASAASDSLGGLTASTIEKAAAEARQGRWALLIIGLSSLAWTSWMLAKTLWAATAFAWHLPVTKLPRPAMSTLVATATPIVAIALMVVVDWMSGDHPLFGLLLIGVLTLALTALFWWVLWVLPHPAAARAIELLPGALLIGAGMQVLHLISVVYLSRKITAAAELYGALGTAATILLWAYLLSRTLIAASMVNLSVHSSGLVLRGARRFRSSNLGDVSETATEVVSRMERDPEEQRERRS